MSDFEREMVSRQGVMERLGDAMRNSSLGRVATMVAVSFTAGAAGELIAAPADAKPPTKKPIYYGSIARASLGGSIYSKVSLEYLETHGIVEEVTPDSFTFDADCKHSAPNAIKNEQRTFAPESTDDLVTWCDGTQHRETIEPGGTLYANPQKVDKHLSKIDSLAKKFAHVQDVESGALVKDKLWPQKDKAVISYEYAGPGSLRKITVLRHKAHAHFND